MSFEAIPARFSASITFAISWEFCDIASRAVEPCVTTPKDVVAVSGSVVTVPLPVTLIVPGRGSVLSARIKAGAATPARAEAASSVAVIQTRWRTLIAAYTAPAAIMSPALRGSGRGRAAECAFAEVRRPRPRDLRRGDTDEEGRRRRRRADAHRVPELLDEAVRLAQVAGRARRHDVLPHGVAAAATRHDVVEREPAGRAAVDAPPAVASEKRAARDLPLHRARHADVADEPDHVRPHERGRRRPERTVERLEHLSLALEHEHVGTLDSAHVQGLIARIQNQDLHQRKCTFKRGFRRLRYRAIARST